jgi:hypothetical protein
MKRNAAMAVKPLAVALLDQIGANERLDVEGFPDWPPLLRRSFH